MKTKARILILLIFLPFAVKSQWHSVNTNSTENLYDITFEDSLTGYCVGGSDNWGTPESNGVILKTIDGGENWTTVYSQDSISIFHVGVVSENNYTKLYGFALKNGASYLISTILSSPSQNWTVEPIDFKPKSILVYDDVIYFVDEIDYSLKKFENNQITTLHEDVSIFDINSFGLLFANANADQLYYSQSPIDQIEAINTHPTNFSENQLSGAKIRLFSSNKYLVYGTYEGAFIYSTDSGNNWEYTGLGNIVALIIINESEIVSYITHNSDLIISNYNLTEVDTVGTLTFSPYLAKVFYNNMAFIIGESGNILKTNNVDLITGTRRNDSLKKKIDIYPNPSSNQLKLQLDEGISIRQIELLETNGKVVKSYPIQLTELDLSGLSAGVYILKIMTDQGVVSKRVVVE